MDYKIIIVGKGASGKDYFQKSLMKKGFSCATLHTSRPSRNGELNGKDYYFITKEYFQTLQFENYFMQVNVFNDWYYGLSYNEWKQSEVFVLTPKNLKELPAEFRKRSYVIYLDIPYDVRRDRLLERNDADDVRRRLGTDEEDFKDFSDYDLRLESFEIKIEI
jgi:guanylate kinase